MSDRTDSPGYSCSHVPSRFESARLAAVDLSPGLAVRKAARAAAMMAAGEVESLLLSGPTGCGKSHLAAAAANQLAMSLWTELVEADVAVRDFELARAAAGIVVVGFQFVPGSPEHLARKRQKRAEANLDNRCPLWISVPGLIERTKRQMGTSNKEADETAADAAVHRGLLVLDDLGAEKASDWTLSVLFDIVGTRYDDQRPTLITSNLTARELTAIGYGRIVSRLADGGSLLEMTTATDYRQRRRKKVAG